MVYFLQSLLKGAVFGLLSSAHIVTSLCMVDWRSIQNIQTGSPVITCGKINIKTLFSPDGSADLEYITR